MLPLPLLRHQRQRRKRRRPPRQAVGSGSRRISASAHLPLRVRPGQASTDTCVFRAFGDTRIPREVESGCVYIAPAGGAVRPRRQATRMWRESGQGRRGRWRAQRKERRAADPALEKQPGAAYGHPMPRAGMPAKAAKRFLVVVLAAATAVSAASSAALAHSTPVKYWLEERQVTKLFDVADGWLVHESDRSCRGVGPSTFLRKKNFYFQTGQVFAHFHCRGRVRDYRSRLYSRRVCAAGHAGPPSVGAVAFTDVRPC